MSRIDSIASQVIPKLSSVAAAAGYASSWLICWRYVGNVWNVAEARDRELAHHDGEREKRAAQGRSADVGKDHTSERRPPARAEVLRRLRQRVDVDRAEAGVEREVDVREREDHVGADEEQVGLAEEPERRVQRVLVELEQADDEDDRRDHERHERHEADQRPQARQLQVHPVDRRHEQQQPDHDRLEREPERELDRRPELRIVEDEPVRAEAAALPGLQPSRG